MSFHPGFTRANFERMRRTLKESVELYQLGLNALNHPDIEKRRWSIERSQAIQARINRILDATNST